MIGDIIKGHLERTKDPLTGITVTRLSDDQAETHHPYFTMPLFVDNGEKILVGSSRTGAWQLYLMTLLDGSMVQLTDGEDVNIGSSLVDSVNRLVYFNRGASVCRIDLETLKQDECLRVPNGFRPTQLSITNDGRYLAFTYGEILEYCKTSGVLYGNMSEHLYRRPSSVVVRLEAATGAYKAVWGEREWISHTNISSTDPDIILFCHEGHWEQVQRMWIVRASTSEVWPLILQQRYLDRVGHEFFLPNGRIGAQFFKRSKASIPFETYGNVFVNPDGSNEKRYTFKRSLSTPSHMQVNADGTLGVGDTAEIRDHQADHRDYISLIRYSDSPEGGRAKIGLLCKHATVWTRQNDHPHPFFHPAGRHVLYSSNQTGRLNLFMAEANFESCILED